LSWVPAGGGAAHTLDSATHTDVDALTEAKGDLLVWNSTTGKWVNLGVGSNTQVLVADSGEVLGVKWDTIGAGSHSLSAGQTDVTITAVADNEVLAYDSGSGDWINQTAAEAGLAVAGHTHLEADITDLDHLTEAEAVAAVEAVASLDLTGDLQVNGGDIGITADTDLIGLASGVVTFRHDIVVNETATFDVEYDNGSQSSNYTLDWNNGNKQKITLTGSFTLTFTDPAGPCNLILKVIQDATGSRIITWDAGNNNKWAGGVAPVISTGGNDVDIIAFYFDGTNYYGLASLDFR